jgi:hypothetical protein
MSVDALDLQDFLYVGVRVNTGHSAEPGQLLCKGLQLRLFPLVQWTAQVRGILHRLLGVSMGD